MLSIRDVRPIERAGEPLIIDGPFAETREQLSITHH